MPAVIRLIDALPTGASGKADRQEVAALFDAAPLAPSEPPQPGNEERVAALWQAVLGAGEVGRHDSFFELGGHSLLATQLVGRMREEFGVELPLQEPSTMGLSAVPGVRRLRQKSPSTTAFSRVLAKLEESLRLHCCRALRPRQGWNFTTSPVARGYGASMHIPVGEVAVSDPTTLRLRSVV